VGGEQDSLPILGAADRFRYCAKTSRAERNAGLDGFEPQPILWSSGEQNPGSFQADGTDRSARNPHPTVKPIALMRWLVRLVSRPGGVVLDPFAGSGSTGCAAVLEGVDFVGIERDPDYLAIAEARIQWWATHGDEALRRAAERDSADRIRQEIADAGQLDLFAATTEGDP
jgi:site-specific DNA-methyltransferase (adenine-specific)